MMKWISIKDMLPKKDALVLATDGEYYCIKKYSFNEFEHYTCNIGCYVKDVLYWMSLPDQPERIKRKDSQ